MWPGRTSPKGYAAGHTMTIVIHPPNLLYLLINPDAPTPPYYLEHTPSLKRRTPPFADNHAITAG